MELTKIKLKQKHQEYDCDEDLMMSKNSKNSEVMSSDEFIDPRQSTNTQ